MHNLISQWLLNYANCMRKVLFLLIMLFRLSFIITSNKYRDKLGHFFGTTSRSRGTKQLVSANICSVEGNSAGIFVRKVSPGIFVIKVK